MGLKLEWQIEGVITDEALDVDRKRVGAIHTEPVVHELANKDSIRRFADVIGDANPLWRDELYAKTTRYGCLVAHPSFLYIVSLGRWFHGFPGVHAYGSGVEWEWYRPVLDGDRLSVETKFTKLEEKQSEFAPRWVVQHHETTYRNQSGELVAKHQLPLIRVARSDVKQRAKYSKIEMPHPWTEEEVTSIEDAMLNEKIRGSEVLYWEDVQVGDEIPELVRGPFRTTDNIGWYVMTHNIQSFTLGIRDVRRHRGLAIFHPETRGHEWIECVHYDIAAARSTGLPYPYDAGTQRQSLLVSSITHWMGDEGWVKKNRVQWRRFFFISDVLWFRGKVAAKYVDEDGDYCVDIESHAINQRDEDTMPGFTTVALPSRENKVWPLERRLPKRS